MYEDRVLEHYKNPYHKGPLPAGPLPVCIGKSVSDVCGDRVEIQARIVNGLIADIGWQGDGCCFSQAAASMLMQYSDHKTVAEMKLFSENDMFALFKADCPQIRRGCVLVAYRALQNLFCQ